MKGVNYLLYSFVSLEKKRKSYKRDKVFKTASCQSSKYTTCIWTHAIVCGGTGDITENESAENQRAEMGGGEAHQMPHHPIHPPSIHTHRTIFSLLHPRSSRRHAHMPHMTPLRHARRPKETLTLTLTANHSGLTRRNHG